MKKPLKLEIQGIHAMLHFLSTHAEIHYTCGKCTPIEGGERLLNYLRTEGFIIDEPIKLISLPINKNSKLK